MRTSKALLLVLAAAAACTTPTKTAPDPRVGLKAGDRDAGEAIGNLKHLVNMRSPSGFDSATHSDLAFTGKYAIQGNYNGLLVYDISTPASPKLVTSFYCPASQNDVSVYKNLLFLSSEATFGRLDCGGQGVRDTVSMERFRGIRIFDISDITQPKIVAQVQTCRGSHTHTVLEDPKDKENVYIYVSGSSNIRSPSELPGCVRQVSDPNSAYFRIEVIKVPLANPAAAAIASSPRFFEGLVAPPRHGDSQADVEARLKEVADAQASGGFVATTDGQERVVSGNQRRSWLDSIARARGGPNAKVTAADSAALRADLQRLVDASERNQTGRRSRELRGRGPTQCHDITVYPAIGRAGGACEGYGFLLDITDPLNPRRIAEVADSNFSYWHSATFNNDGTKILFSDEWGGGSSPKCRAGDPKEWGANALFTIDNGKMNFRSYYKLPAVQTSLENCVAHNGSLIPIPGRDVMVQSWYQGGISVFDWTDASNPKEIAYFDRGPIDSTRYNDNGGTWSAYWYNGAMFSSEIGRGFDVVELVPSEFVTQNEIDAARTVKLDYFNAQGQPKFVWPPSFPLARAYVDQLERNKCLSAQRIAAIRSGLATAEAQTGAARRDGLMSISAGLQNDARSSCDQPRVMKLMSATQGLAGIQP